MKNRVVFFGDSNSYISTILFKKFLKNLSESFELVAVVNTAPNNKNNKIKSFIVFGVKKLFNPFDKNIKYRSYENFLTIVNSDIKLIESENINDLEFIKSIKSVKPDFAFLIGCPQIFKKNLIECFDKVINYHNSYLPTYRGLEATSWAMTYKEKYSGYTFHYVNEKIDDGKIVLQEKIEIDYSKSSYENELIKTKEAGKNMSRLFDLVFSNFEGYSQVGNQSYFGIKQKEKLSTFEKIDDIQMIQRLIRIWGGVKLLSNNETIFVTKIADDGKIKRIKWLPPKTYTILNFFKSLLSNNRINDAKY